MINEVLQTFPTLNSTWVDTWKMCHRPTEFSILISIYRLLFFLWRLILYQISINLITLYLSRKWKRVTFFAVKSSFFLKLLAKYIFPVHITAWRSQLLIKNFRSRYLLSWNNYLHTCTRFSLSPQHTEIISLSLRGRRIQTKTQIHP